MSLHPQQVVEYWNAGLISKDEAREMLGLDKPATDTTKPFETLAAKMRFIDCLAACGIYVNK